MNYGFSFGYLGSGGGGMSGGGTTAPAPKVLSSTISTASPDGIMIQWNIPMGVSCDIKSQIRLEINNVQVAVTSVDFNMADNKQMVIMSSVAFKAGDVVTWGFDDSGSCSLHSAADQTITVISQTYNVTNNISFSQPTLISADMTTITADSTQYTADKGA